MLHDPTCEGSSIIATGEAISSEASPDSADVCCCKGGLWQRPYPRGRICVCIMSTQGPRKVAVCVSVCCTFWRQAFSLLTEGNAYRLTGAISRSCIIGSAFYTVRNSNQRSAPRQHFVGSLGRQPSRPRGLSDGQQSASKLGLSLTIRCIRQSGHRLRTHQALGELSAFRFQAGTHRQDLRSLHSDGSTQPVPGD